MKLLFDENLSPKLPGQLEDLFPGSSHVRDKDLKGRPDFEVWTFALNEGFTIVTKDIDFDNLALLYGKPPKVVRIHLGNCATHSVEVLLRTAYEDICRFENSGDDIVLILP